jgi:xylulokinase
MGLDIGTTGCKAAAFDETGQLIAQAYREYRLLSPQPGWAELDSTEVCKHCMDIINQVSRECSNDPVKAIGISSQGEAFTPVDKNGETLGNAMISSDTRATEIAKTWSKQFGPEKLYRITGHTTHPMFTLFKLLWVRENQPDVWLGAKGFYCFEDLLHQRLGLTPAISWPLAGRTMMFNVLEHTWDSEILSAVGLKAEKLARPLPSGTIVGTIPGGVAQNLGLGKGTIVVTGGHDQTCSALGAGVTSPGKAMYATGTVDCICAAFCKPKFSSELMQSNLCTYDYTLPDMYTTVAFSLTGGNILKWFRDQFATQEVQMATQKGINVYELILKKMPDTPSALMVLPYFTPSGTPYFDAETKGAILGLRLSSSKEDLLRAILEGVAFEMRLNIEILTRSRIEISEFIVTGGGARSAAWNQLKANVIGKPVTIAPVEETGCLGAAMLARSSLTGTSVKDLDAKMVQSETTIQPDRKQTDYYAERYATYKKLYPALKSLDL